MRLVFLCGHDQLECGILELKVKDVIRNRTRDVPRGEAKEFDDEARNGIVTAGDNIVLQVIVRTRSNALAGTHVTARTMTVCAS